MVLLYLFSNFIFKVLQDYDSCMYSLLFSNVGLSSKTYHFNLTVFKRTKGNVCKKRSKEKTSYLERWTICPSWCQTVSWQRQQRLCPYAFAPTQSKEHEPLNEISFVSRQFRDPSDCHYASLWTDFYDERVEKYCISLNWYSVFNFSLQM